MSQCAVGVVGVVTGSTMPRRNRNAGWRHDLAKGHETPELRRLLASIASKADTRTGVGRATKETERSEVLTARRRRPLPAQLP